MSSLLSCANCWYNPLQSGSFGAPYGYCVEHNFVLRRSDETTCSLQMRKDLLLPAARAEQQNHARVFGPGSSLKLVNGAADADPEVYRAEPDTSLNGDPVVNIVCDYGLLNTKIESLAQLRFMQNARAETAMLNLARGYTRRCVENQGSWTSGLHLLWWTRERMQADPEPRVTIDDLRYQLPVSINRQQELVRWSLIMLRLVYIADVAGHAQSDGDRVAELSSIAEDAAADTEIISLRKLRAWVKREAIPRFDAALDRARYRRLAQQVRQPPAAQEH
jgi:hypothetical protein